MRALSRLVALFCAASLCPGSGMFPYPPASEITQILNHAELVMQLYTQGQQLAQQISMFKSMTLQGKLLTAMQFGHLTQDLVHLSRNLRQGHGLAYTMTNLDAAFRIAYPGYAQITTNNPFGPQYAGWNRDTLDTLAGVLKGIGTNATQLSSDAVILNFAQQHAASAVGQAQIAQAGAEIAALNVGGLMKLRQLMYLQTTAIVAASGRQVNNDQVQQQILQNAIGPGKFTAGN